MEKVRLHRRVVPRAGKPLGNTLGKRLVGAYGSLVFLLILILALNERAGNQQGVASLSILPPPIWQEVHDLDSRFVRNRVPLTMAVATDGVIHAGVGRSLWTVSGDVQGQHAYFQYDRIQRYLVRFSQSDPDEWSKDREQWTVNDGRVAVATGQRYLRSLGWEGAGSHWQPQGKPDLVDSIWRLTYRQGNQRVLLRVHRWNGVLVYLSRI